MLSYEVKCKFEKARIRQVYKIVTEDSLPALFPLLILGLVVAVIDHEHFRMKLMYKQKKQIASDLKTAKNNFKDLQVNIKSPFYLFKKIILHYKNIFFKFYFVKCIMMEILFQEKS